VEFETNAQTFLISEDSSTANGGTVRKFRVASMSETSARLQPIDEITPEICLAIDPLVSLSNGVHSGIGACRKEGSAHGTGYCEPDHVPALRMSGSV
jgi:hypothetical protein